WVPHILVDTAHPMAMKKVVEWIEAGHTVGIFPEGRMTVTGSLMKVYDGPVFLAAKTGATVLPMFLDGAVRSRFSRMKPPFPTRWRPPVTITFFPPRVIAMPAARTARERRRLATEEVRRLLQKMCFDVEPPRTLPDAFLDAIELYGRKAEILQDIQQDYSYGKLLKGVLALHRLTSPLTSENERVGVLMPNAGATAALVFGLLFGRRVPAMLNYTAGVDGMQTAIRVARLRTIFTSRSFLERARLTEKVAQLRDVRLVYLEDLRAQFGLADKLWLLLWALPRPRSVLRKASPSEPAVVLFTSGSEGKPKGVVLSHAAIHANIRQAKSVVEFSNRDRFLGSMPLFHSFGLTGCLMMPLLSGAYVFLYPSPLHYRIIPEMLYDQDCTVMFGTSTFLSYYARYANPYDFRSVRYVIAGAEKLNEEVRRTYQDRFGIRILEGYGATECAPVISLNTPMACRAGSVGHILPGMEHRIVPVPGLDRGGVLHVRGPNLMLGYLRDDQPGVVQPPRSSAGDGWYDTGDVVEIDGDGYLSVLGRVRRFAKIAGEMISLETSETIALEASPKKSHAAAAVADPARGETILLFTDDPDLRREQLMNAARRLGLPEVAVARRIERIPTIPRLATGKCDYVALKAMADAAAAERPVEVRS
ncbi:MAG: AMP-binding protein, partial [Bryobacteraceae bacterium]